MTNREIDFCREYARLYNGTEAALAVGYGKGEDETKKRKAAGQAAYRLLKKLEVKEEIERILKNAANESGATPLYITEKLKEVADRCLQEISPKMEYSEEEKKMVPSGEYWFNANGAVNALKTLADIQGLKSEKLRLASDKDDELEIKLTVLE